MFTFAIPNEESILTYYLIKSKRSCPTTTRLFKCLIFETSLSLKNLSLSAYAEFNSHQYSHFFNNIAVSMNVIIHVADKSHLQYAQPICDLIYLSAQARGTGIAERAVDYIEEKMKSGKAVIALDGNILVGFAYIETWSHRRFVANSGLIVNPDYRGQGFARKIKHRIFKLSRELYPKAKIFSITTGLAVMKMNTELGFKPVTFSELTDDK